MLCISVTPTSRQLAKVDLLNASRQGDLIELCLDHLVKEPNLGDMLEGISKPVLVSCRRPQDGGQWKGTEEQRISLLRQAIVAGPAYVELELDIATQIPRFGSTKRVVSFTSLQKPLGNVDAIFEEAWQAKADVVKFTWPTPTLETAWPLLAAVTRKRELPVVGFGIGAAGVTYSLLALRYGSPWIYAALEHGMEAFPGQATVGDLDELYGWRGIDSRTRFVGVVNRGAPDASTVKTLNSGFAAAELPMRALPLSLAAHDKLAQMLDVLKMNALIVSPACGEQLLGFAPHVEPEASASGYCDLLLKQPDGWHAYNLLWRPALRALEETLGRQSSDDRPLDRRNVLLVGAGPLSRAVAYGVARRKGIVSVTSPDEAAANRLAGAIGVRHVPFAALYDTLADVVVITDPAVKAGHHRSELNPAYFRPGMTVADLSHMPDETDFLREARERGCRVVEPGAVSRELIAAQFKAATGKELMV